MITGTSIGIAYDRTAVLEDIEITAGPGEVVGLIGPNGSGKSTLLRTLHGALTPKPGHAHIDDAPLAELTPREVARQIAVVVQESDTDVPFTVREMVLLGRTPHRRSFERHTNTDHDIVTAALEKVSVKHLSDRVFAGLSGGEKQRVLIARAIAQGAPHLLLDEPTNHLDVRYQHEILTLVREIGVTTIVVLHDLNLAARYCDRLILLHEGRKITEGTPADVLTPQIIETVYGIAVERIEHAGVPQLIFAPPSVTAQR